MFKNLFNFGNKNDNSAITEVFNPLGINLSSAVEFKVGELKDGGMFMFRKIIEMDVSKRKYTRYIIYSNLTEGEYILEVYMEPNSTNREIFIYHLQDTVPFSQEFLNDVAGQRYIQTPDGPEFSRCLSFEDEDRMDGLKGTAVVYNIETKQVESKLEVYLWDYERDRDDGIKEYLNLEMMEEDGIFRIFIGEIIEDPFIELFNTSK